MNIVSYPSPAQWPELLRRPVMSQGDIEQRVRPILAEVHRRGDEALFEFAERFDGVKLRSLAVSEAEWSAAAALVPAELRQAIMTAKANIETFHAAQREHMPVIETMPGVRCWRKSVAIQKVGLYIPGGTAPLFSTLLMLGVPAVLAGCADIVVCTPPDREGQIHPAILFTAHLLGIKQVFKVGGAQAVAAMAYGTQSIPATYKIFGPGNQYVTAAKQIVSQEGVAIDMPAGPSEVAVFADHSAHPAFVAADLLSQAEHGADSQVLLVTTSEAIAQAVRAELALQLERLPRRQFAEQSLANSRAIIVHDARQAMQLLNAYAAEHLILASDQADELAAQVINAGSVFLGHYTPESVGDYASGTNHTLPTNGYARAYSGVSLDSFFRKITFQALTPEGLQHLGPTVETMAAHEGLEAHRQAVSLRLLHTAQS